MKNKGNRTVIFLTVLSYCLYFIQGGLYERGSLVPRLSLLFILIIDVVYWIKALKQNNSFITYPVSAFFALLILSWLLSPKVVFMGPDPVSTQGEIKNAFIFLLSYFPFRFWINKGILDTYNVRRILILFFLVYVAGFFIKLYETLDIEIWRNGDVTNNGGYMIAFIFPLMSFFFRERKYWIFATISLLLVLMSAKRGAILCVSIELFLFILFKFKTTKTRNIIYVFVTFFILAYVAYQYIGSNDYLIERLHSDSSGRDEIYGDAWKAFLQGDLAQHVLGYGFLQTITNTGMYAHSDWFEILDDNGLVGVLLYFLVFCSMAKTYLSRVRKQAEEYQLMFCSAVCCWFTTSLFSMGYLAPEASMLMIAVAISEKGVKDV